mgnify:CR=1 FL=1
MCVRLLCWFIFSRACPSARRQRTAVPRSGIGALAFGANRRSAHYRVAIIHADMDAFYARVGQRDNLYLKGCSLWSGVVVDEG